MYLCLHARVLLLLNTGSKNKTTSESCNKVVQHDTMIQKENSPKLIRTVTTALWLFLFVRQKPASRVSWLHNQPSFDCVLTFRLSATVSADASGWFRKPSMCSQPSERCLSVQSGVSNLLRCPRPTSARSRCLARTDGQVAAESFLLYHSILICAFLWFCWFLIVLTSDKMSDCACR